MLRHDYGLGESALGFWSPLTLLVLAVTSLAVRYVTSPITCWTPAQFEASQVAYVHQVCFQQKSIYTTIDHDNDPPLKGPGMYNTYHQWVPFALGMFAILCLLPYTLWRMLSGFLWLDTHALAQTIADNQRQNAPGRHVMLRDSALMVQAGLKGGNWILSAAVLLRKVLSFVLCVVLLVLVVVLFDPQLGVEKEGDGGYGTSVDLPQDPFHCYVPIRMMTNVRRYTLQCFLPLTQVYSKGFTFLFYFFLLLAVCCALDLVAFAGRLAIPGLRDLNLRRYLAATAEVDQDPHQASRFLDTLGVDGHMLLAVVADACGPLAAADLTNHLWLAFRGMSRPGPISTAPTSPIPPAGYAPPTVGVSSPQSYTFTDPSHAVGDAPPTKTAMAEGGASGDGEKTTTTSASLDDVPLQDFPVSSEGDGSDTSKLV